MSAALDTHTHTQHRTVGIRKVFSRVRIPINKCGIIMMSIECLYIGTGKVLKIVSHHSSLDLYSHTAVYCTYTHAH